MTPLLFISFLVSLALVDLHHSALRSHYHAEGSQPSALPGWLHRIVYRYRPYRYAAVDERGHPRSSGGEEGSPGGSVSSFSSSPGGTTASPGSVLDSAAGEDYYHSKQRKLMRMEAAEAFEIRGGVVVGLGLVSLAMLWAAWKVMVWGWGFAKVWVMMLFYGC